MRIAMITRSVPATFCGVADYTAQMSRYLVQQGAEVSLWTGTDQNFSSAGMAVHPIVPQWDQAGLTLLFEQLTLAQPQIVMLQYTPPFYGGQFNRALIPFWQHCQRAGWQTVLVLHEAYMHEGHLKNRLVGQVQKYVLAQLLRASRGVITTLDWATNLVQKLAPQVATVQIPVSSNIPLVPIQDPRALRAALGFEQQDLILGLFGHSAGCDVSLVGYLQKALPHPWLFLGKIAPKLRGGKHPGYLAPTDLSAHLQLIDILICPVKTGVSGRNGTLMAALEHGIATVATCGALTDQCFRQAQIPYLVPTGDQEAMLKAVRSLRDPQARQQLSQRSRQFYRDHLSWSIACTRILRWLAGLGEEPVYNK